MTNYSTEEKRRVDWTFGIAYGDDINKAKELLKEAGWIDTDGDNIRDKIVDGEKLQFKFKLSYMSSNTTKVIALLIKECSMDSFSFNPNFLSMPSIDSEPKILIKSS